MYFSCVNCHWSRRRLATEATNNLIVNFRNSHRGLSATLSGSDPCEITMRIRIIRSLTTARAPYRILSRIPA
jgi:hypothetical protein